MEARTTENRLLMFDSDYHPWFLDRVRGALASKPYLDQDFVTLAPTQKKATPHKQH